MNSENLKPLKRINMNSALGRTGGNMSALGLPVIILAWGVEQPY